MFMDDALSATGFGSCKERISVAKEGGVQLNKEEKSEDEDQDG